MKKILLISSILFLILIISLIGVWMKVKNSYSEENQSMESGKINVNQNNQIDMSEVPLDKLVEDEVGVYYGHSENRVTSNGNPIVRLIFSPSGEKVGFLENRDIYDESIPFDRQVILHAGDVKKKDFRELYHGSFRTSGWEWFNENEVAVYYNCGTECQLLYLADVYSGEGNSLVYGVNYEWSPNKELSLAYHYYSWGIYGITVGGKKGNELFSVTRNPAHNDNWELIGKTKAKWSPDSSKLALIIKKENKNQMELLVFDVSNNFKQIFRWDADNADEYNLEWDENSKSVSLNHTDIKI